MTVPAQIESVATRSGCAVSKLQVDDQVWHRLFRKYEHPNKTSWVNIAVECCIETKLKLSKMLAMMDPQAKRWVFQGTTQTEFHTVCHCNKCLCHQIYILALYLMQRSDRAALSLGCSSEEDTSLPQPGCHQAQLVPGISDTLFIWGVEYLACAASLPFECIKEAFRQMYIIFTVPVC